MTYPEAADGAGMTQEARAECQKLVADAIVLERAARVLERRTTIKGQRTFAYKLNRKALLRVAARLRQLSEEELAVMPEVPEEDRPWRGGGEVPGG